MIHDAYMESMEMEGGKRRAEICISPRFYFRDGLWRVAGNALGNSGDPIMTVGVNELFDFRIRSKIAGESPLAHFGRGSESIRMTPLDTNNTDGGISGNTITFPEAWNNADLRYVARGCAIKKEIILRSGHPASFAFRVDEKNGLDENLKGTGWGMKAPYLEKAGEERRNLAWVKTTLGGKDIYTVTLPAGDWAGWTLDPTMEIEGSANARITGNNTTYATARSTSFSFSTSIYRVGQGGAYYIHRLFLKFDTAALSGCAINQANLRLVCSADNSATNFDVQIIEQDWSGQDPIDDGNRETAYDNCLAAAASVLWRNTSGMSANTQYTSENLTAGYVNTAGNTYYSLRSSMDKAATAPTGNEYLDFYAYDNATASYRPALVVDYTEAAGGQPMGLRTSRMNSISPMRAGRFIHG